MISMIFLVSIFFLLFPILFTILQKRMVFSEKTLFAMELVILFLSIYMHLFLSILNPIGDTGYFTSILTRLDEGHFFGLYEGSGITYPPLFNYIFLCIARVMRLIGIPFGQNQAFVFGVKLPQILCEMCMAGIIWRTAKKHLSQQQTVLALYLILLNPGYIFITSYICQVDALYSLFVLLTVWLIMERHLKLSYFCFAAGILLKFQTIFITPLLIGAVIDQVILHDFSVKRFFAHLGTGLAAIGCMALSYVPFLYDFEHHQFGEAGLTQNFTNSIASYGKASQNAYNFWTLVGYNEIPHSELFGPLSCHAWGTLFIILLVIFSLVFFFRSQADSSFYPMIAAFLVGGTYCFAVKMMSRYLYPAIVLLILGYALKPTMQRLLLSILFSVAFFLVTGFDYLVYPWLSYSKDLILPYVVSFYVVVCFGFLVVVMCREIREGKQGMAKAAQCNRD